MTEYRNIDSIVKDSTVPITIAPSLRKLVVTGFPQIRDQVSLDTDQGYSMMVEVTWISDDQETLKGRVTQGYFPMEESKHVDVGAMVEFSRMKVGGIHRT